MWSGIEILSRQGWLSGQPESFRAAVLSAGYVRSFPKGQVVYAQGAAPGGVYGIVSGALTFTIAPGQRGPHVVHLAAPGSWIGEGSFMTGEARRTGIEAIIDSRLFYLPLEAMEALVGGSLTRRFGQLVIQNVELAFHVIDDLLIPDSERRIAAALLRWLGGKHGPAHLSQSELGRLANASRKVVNRTLRHFAERGWVKPGYSTIEVSDAKSLQAFADGETA